MEAQPPSAYMHAVHDALRSQAWALSGLGPRTLNLGITLFCRALFTLHSPSRDAATRCTVGLSWQDPMPAPSNKHALTQTLEHQRRQQEGAEVAAAGKRHAPDPGPESRRGPRLRPRSPPWQTWQKVTSSAESHPGRRGGEGLTATDPWREKRQVRNAAMRAVIRSLAHARA